MNQWSIEVHSATLDEMPRTISAIVAAFLEDPPARFAWPCPHAYLQAMPLAVRELASSSIKHAVAYVSADFCGAALWLPPGVEMDGEAIEQLFRKTAKREHLNDLLATFEQMAQSHPREAHWYLPQIGVDPNAQGKGIGSKLMRHALKRCDQEHALAYLEASKPQNIPFYQYHGFEVMGEIQVGSGPVITPMLRRPR